MKPNIENKVILITGASSGIGEATARELASRGAKVLLGARRTDRLDKIVAEIRAAGGTAECRALDVTSFDDMKAFAAFGEEKLGPGIDVLINNAGIMPLSPLHELKINEWNRMIDVNIRGVLRHRSRPARHAGAEIRPHHQPLLHRRPSGLGHVRRLSRDEFGVLAISEGMRLENTDVRVTVISPGVVESELADTISDQGTREAMQDFRKVALTPDAIARAIAYAIEQPADVDVNEIIVRPTAGAQ